MAGSHPDAMAPRKPGRTRTAPPQMPTTWWSAPRIRTYLLFDATGLVYLLFGLVTLDIVLTIGLGAEKWTEAMVRLQHPLYILFHLLALASVVFVGVRFFRLFPKAQPSAIGPLKPPPGPVIHAMLYVAWAGLTLVVSLVLGGVIF